MIDIEKIKNHKVSEKSQISQIAEHIFTPDQKRNESEKQHLHWVKIALLWSLMITIIIVGLVILLHLILPEKCRWLSSNEIMNLKSMFVSGIGGAILTKFGNKLLQ